jgi:hypothetical protein
LATFIAATTLKPDGYFKSSSATGSIAGLEYALRLCVINEATEDMHQRHFEENEDDDGQRLLSNGVCVDYIMKWTRYHEPSGENFRNHTVLLLLSHLKARIIRFSPENTVASVQFVDRILKTDLMIVTSGQMVSLSKLRQMVTSTFTSAEVMMEELLAPFTGIKEFDIFKLHDKMFEEAPGYSFVTDRRNNLEHLWLDFLEQTDWDDPIFQLQFLEKMEKLRDALFILMHLTLGSPSRATSLTILQLLNTDTMMRSFVVFGGDLFMMTRYRKQRSMIQCDIIGIKCFSPRLADIFVPYLILLRNTENAIQNHVNGGSRLDSASYFTYYFVKEDGRPFSENGNDLCQLFSTSMASDGEGIPIGMRDYRQCAAAWIRCHVQQKHSVDLNTHLEAQFDHGESAGNLYGCTKDDPHSYTVMANAKFASARFYEFMSPVNAITNNEANQLQELESYSYMSDK